MRLSKRLAIHETFYGDPDWTRTNDLRLRRRGVSFPKISKFPSTYERLERISLPSFYSKFTNMCIGVNRHCGGNVGEDRLLDPEGLFPNKSALISKILTNPQIKTSPENNSLWRPVCNPFPGPTSVSLGIDGRCHGRSSQFKLSSTDGALNQQPKPKENQNEHPR